MGRQKLLVKTGSDDRPIGTMALDEAVQSRLDDVTVVSRAPYLTLWEKYSAAFDSVELSGRVRVEVSVIAGDEAALGLSRSIRTGMKAALREEADAIVVLLADQPLITAAMIDRLIGVFLADPGLHYVAYHDGVTMMPPMLLADQLFPDLLELKGDRGAKVLLTRPGIRGRVITAECPDWLHDIDTEHDLETLEHIMKQSAGEERGESHGPIRRSDDRDCEDVRYGRR